MAKSIKSYGQSKHLGKKKVAKKKTETVSIARRNKRFQRET